jgi:hypothetical protein
MPFQRTALPGLSVVGAVETDNGAVELHTVRTEAWEAQVDESRLFPMGLVDDPFLHVQFPGTLVVVRPGILTPADQRARRPRRAVCAHNPDSVRHQDIKWRSSTMEAPSTADSNARGEQRCGGHHPFMQQHTC